MVILATTAPPASLSNRADLCASVSQVGKAKFATLTWTTALKNLVCLEQTAPTWWTTLAALAHQVLLENDARTRSICALRVPARTASALTSYSIKSVCASPDGQGKVARLILMIVRPILARMEDIVQIWWTILSALVNLDSLVSHNNNDINSILISLAF